MERWLIVLALVGCSDMDRYHVEELYRKNAKREKIYRNHDENEFPEQSIIYKEKKRSPWETPQQY